MPGEANELLIDYVLQEKINSLKIMSLAKLNRELKEVLSKIQPVSAEHFAAMARAWNNLGKPLYAYGELEKYLSRIGAIQRSTDPQLRPAALACFVADNGIISEGVSQSGSEVSTQVMLNMTEDKATVSLWSKYLDVDLAIFNLGCVDCSKTPAGVYDAVICPQGTANFLRKPAMTEEECLKALLIGHATALHLAAQGGQILVGGEMGIGNTTSSTALICLCAGADPWEVCGRGAGLSDENLLRKKAVIQQAVEKYQDFRTDPLAALASVGGLDIAALCGFFLGAAQSKKVVILDGLITYAAALIACKLKPECKDYLLPSHKPRERASQQVANLLGIHASLDLDIALGEGAGALLLLPLLDLAKEAWAKLPCFEEANIETYIDYTEYVDD